MAKCRKSKREQARQTERVITCMKTQPKKCQWRGGAISLDQCVHLTSEADHDFTKEAEKSTRVFLRTDCVLFLCMEQWCSVNNAGT